MQKQSLSYCAQRQRHGACIVELSIERTQTRNDQFKRLLDFLRERILELVRVQNRAENGTNIAIGFGEWLVAYSLWQNHFLPHAICYSLLAVLEMR